MDLGDEISGSNELTLICCFPIVPKGFRHSQHEHLVFTNVTKFLSSERITDDDQFHSQVPSSTSTSMRGRAVDSGDEISCSNVVFIVVVGDTESSR